MPIKIMIVDDSRFMRLVLRGLIKSIDVDDTIEIIEAGDGSEAIQKYFKYHPHIVFLDIVMPNKSGLEVLNEIKSKDPNAKVIIISAVGHEELVRKALKVGAIGYVVKPFHPDLLKELLHSILGGATNASKESQSPYCR